MCSQIHPVQDLFCLQKWWGCALWFQGVQMQAGTETEHKRQDKVIVVLIMIQTHGMNTENEHVNK